MGLMHSSTVRITSKGVCHLPSSVLKICQACCVPACVSDRDEQESKFTLIL